jgi:single-stranded-DNA-specific exonuclease
MCYLTTLENRYICQYGLNHINNQFLKDLIEKQSYSLGTGPLTPTGVAFYLTPLINALIRVGTMNEKEKLFESFINGTKEIPSTKRGESGLLETVSVQSVRNCVNAKSKQNREKEKAMELLDIQILENCLDENKILILNADELDVPNSLTGLIAMGVSAKYKKPVLLGRTSPDGFLKGSGRGRNGSELQDFRQFLLDSGYMDFAEGQRWPDNI